MAERPRIASSAERRLHARAFELFDAASGLEPAERAAFIEEASAGEPELQQLLLSLFAEADGDSSLLDLGDRLEEAAAEVCERLGAKAAAAGRLPEKIGGHRILRLLGRGGMGAVYEARQERPQRRVAVKVLASPLASPELLARFHREAELLGRLQDPGIAQVFEAGADESLGVAGGQPYFVMELIEGAPITQHARDRGLGSRDCLALMAKVCDAVAHAHSCGVIHRDLKPANILVTPSGQPKVLDFGVARCAGDEALSTLQTNTGQLLGTLAYMSPEQAGGRQQEVDEQADVYALGVVLFEMLAGRLPHEVEQLSLGEALDVIRHDAAPALSTLGEGRRGDIETIVATALQKDRARRYRSVSEFAADIRRHLEHEPIRARPVSLGYRLRKLVRRHPGLSSLGALLALTVVIAAAYTSNARRQAADEAERALQELVRGSLQEAEDALRQHGAEIARGSLERIPEDARGWEWRHLWSRLDDSDQQLASFSAPRTSSGVARSTPIVSDSGGRFLLASPQAGPAGAITILSWDGRAPEASEPLTLMPGRPVAREHFPFVLDRFLRNRGDALLQDTESQRPRKLFPCEDPDAGWTIEGVDSSQELRPEGVLQRMAGPDGGALWFCDWTTGTVRAVAPGARQGAWAVGPTGLVASGANEEDGSVLILDPERGEVVARWEAHSARICDLAFAPRSGLLLTASQDGAVKAWEPLTGRLRGERHLAAGSAWRLAIDPASEQVAVAVDDHSLRLLDARLLRELNVLHGHGARVSNMRFGPGGRLVSVDQSGRVLAWDRPSILAEVLPLKAWGLTVAYSADGTMLFTTEGRRTLSAWDAAAGQLVARWTWPSTGMGNAAPAVDRRGRRVAFARPGEVLLLDTWTGRYTELPGRRVRSMRWEPTGPRLVLAADGELLTVDAVSGETVSRHQTSPGSSLLSADGSRLAVLTKAGLQLWDAATGQRLRSSEAAPSAVAAGRTLLMDWSDDGRWIAGIEDRELLCIWDASSGRLVARRPAGRGRLYAVTFLPGSERFVTGARDGLLRVWSIPELVELVAIAGHRDYLRGLTVSPDGETVVSVSGDSTARTWSTSPARERHLARAEREALVERAGLLLAERRAAGLADDALALSLDADASLAPDLRRVAIQLAVGRVAAEASAD